MTIKMINTWHPHTHFHTFKKNTHTQKASKQLNCQINARRHRGRDESKKFLIKKSTNSE